MPRPKVGASDVAAGTFLHLLMPLVFVSALIGLLIGPSLHHVAVAAGAKRPLVGPRPRCPECGAPRPARAWFVGTCAVCGESTLRREWVVTLASGVALAGAAWAAGSPWLVPGYLVFGAVTLTLVITDLDHKLIPNRVLYPGGALAAFLLAVGAWFDGRAADLPRAIGGAAGYFGILFVVALVARGGFGLGDVKLGALLGLFAAFEGLRIFLLAIFFTGVYGGVPAIALLVSRRARRGDELPYGPAMIAGAWTALAFGRQFLSWYGG